MSNIYIVFNDLLLFNHLNIDTILNLSLEMELGILLTNIKLQCLNKSIDYGKLKLYPKQQSRKKFKLDHQNNIEQTTPAIVNTFISI